MSKEVDADAQLIGPAIAELGARLTFIYTMKGLSI